MTEKRFECDKGSRIIIDNETKLHYIMTLDWECRLVTKLLNNFVEENEQLKASLYAEKTNTAEVVNEYSKQFKRHSAQFSFMMDLADDLGVDVTTLEALDD